MEVKIHTKNMTLTPRLEDYVNKKIDKLARYLPNISDVRVDLRQEKKNGKDMPAIQLTVRNQRGTLLRAEERKETEVFAAIDVVIDKMYKQISRYKGKSQKRKGKSGNPTKWLEAETEWDTMEMVPVTADDIDDYDNEERQVLRRKTVMLTPMSEPEAIDQMDLLGHDFFLFYNGEEDAINVLYRRKDGNYGILTPRID